MTREEELENMVLLQEAAKESAYRGKYRERDEKENAWMLLEKIAEHTDLCFMCEELGKCVKDCQITDNQQCIHALLELHKKKCLV